MLGCGLKDIPENERNKIREEIMANTPEIAIEFTETQLDISRTCLAIERFLIEKNRRYGDSALKPARKFSKADNVEQLLVRIDDKLNRIGNSDELRKNDVVDVTGYLILLCVAKGWTDFDELVD